MMAVHSSVVRTLAVVLCCIMLLLTGRFILAAVQPIFTKFGTLVQFDPLDCSGR